MVSKPPNTDTKAKTAPDWERIELEYRAGLLTLRQIADANGLTHGAINKRAKKEGWTRDLTAKIQAKADELVSKSLVSKDAVSSAVSKVTEKQAVEANGEAIATVRLAHRKDIARARTLANALLDELEAQVDPAHQEALRELGKVMFTPNQAGRDALNEIYMAVIGTPERAKTMKTLAESLRITVDMERTAFGMDASKRPGETESDPTTNGRPMTNTERAVRMTALFRENPDALLSLLAAAQKGKPDDHQH